MTAADRLAALEQAHAAATPGPWTTDIVFWKLGSTRGQSDGWWWDVQGPEGTVAMVQTDGRGREDDDARAIAAAIVAEHNATPALIAALRAVLDLADEWEKDSRDALRIAGAARDRGDREVHRINARHARVAHQAAINFRAAIDAALGVDSGQQ